DRGTRLAERDDLGVGSGVRVAEIAVTSTADDLAITDHDGSHRNFPGLECALGSAKRFLHKQFIRLRVVRPGNVRVLQLLDPSFSRVPHPSFAYLAKRVGDGNHHHTSGTSVTSERREK